MSLSETCGDCGCTPAHEDMPNLARCRSCASKGGHDYAFKTTIDHDKLRAKVGRELAAEIIAECKDTWS